MLSVRQIRRRSERGGRGYYLISSEGFRMLTTIMANIKTQKEAERLAHSLLTNRELSDITRRIIIAKMLERGWTYDTIAKATNSSRHTIALVSNAATNGSGIITKILNRTPQLVNIQLENILKRIKKGK